MGEGWGQLHVTVRDGATKELLPVRMHIKRPEGTAYVPPCGLDDRFDEGHAPAVLVTEHYRKNLHLCASAQIQSTHLTRGEATFPIPAGEFQIFVWKGFERTPIVEGFVVKIGETTHLDLDLKRVTNSRDAGWYSGDMHVHFSRFDVRDDYVLAQLMAGDDLSAVNNMVYKHVGKIEAPQREMGHANSHYQLHHSHQVVAGGEEFRDNNFYGHMIAAGISRVIEPISVGEQLGRCEPYPLFANVCDWTHDQGGVAGWAHGGTLIKLLESLPVEAALGKLDFVESIQFNCFLGFAFWYRLLNCGLRLAVTGGSDFPFRADMLAPWFINLGQDRTYVQLGANTAFDYNSYLEGVRQGRCFATNGPLIFFTVEGQGPGAVVKAEHSEDTIAISARAVCMYPMDRVEIVANGAVIYTEEGKGGQREIAFETRLPLEESMWLAARVRGRVYPETYGAKAPWNLHAHSGAVYVYKGGRPVLSRADATAMADYVRFLTEFYRQDTRFDDERHGAELFENMETALQYYENLLKP
ncbi:MAG: CehA/McbA family metallohydrolase [Candidatus Hydrogenedentes bacterium]|nr:CehA/McbA family metallohydrolase [Candidatus Hydrogenedentota bacterium]